MSECSDLVQSVADGHYFTLVDLVASWCSDCAGAGRYTPACPVVVYFRESSVLQDIEERGQAALFMSLGDDDDGDEDDDG